MKRSTAIALTRKALAALDPEEIALMVKVTEEQIKKFGGKVKARGKGGKMWKVVFAGPEIAQYFHKAMYDLAGRGKPNTVPSTSLAQGKNHVWVNFS